MCFDYLLSETFLTLRRTEVDIIKSVHWSSCLNSRPIVMKPEYSRQIFRNTLEYKFHEALFSGSQVVLCGQTDRHDEANSRFS